MRPELMRLEVLLPFRIFLDRSDVSRVVAETAAGSFGLLPHRLDCVAALVPGILTFETVTDEEVFVAVDEGVLIKTGLAVRVSVRRAMRGDNLDHLREAVEREFRVQDEQALALRAVTDRLESGLVSKLAKLDHV